MAEKPTNMNEWASSNAYVGYNLDKCATQLKRIADTLNKMNWNLGIIANPELAKKYPDTEKELGTDSPTPEDLND